jgi:hypothetical protein
MRVGVCLRTGVIGRLFNKCGWRGSLVGMLCLVWTASGSPVDLVGQAPMDEVPDVIQIVTFRFAPGQAGEAIEVFRDLALPLYEQDPDMLEFRAYREVESPSALDLVVISHFRGMAGMDRSNAKLRTLATETGSSMGAVYGGIGALSVGHTDEFVELVTGDNLASMDGSRLVVLEYLEAQRSADPQSAPRSVYLPNNAGVSGGIGGPVLIADGWGYFRMYGAESLGTVHAVARTPGMSLIDGNVPVTRRKRVVLAPVPELSVR